jgi:predicted dehydrogenase
MSQNADGMNYAPQGKPAPVVEPGEFVFSVIALDHGHINGQTNGLVEAGATLKQVWDPDPDKCAAFKKNYDQVAIASSKEEILNDESIHMIASAAIPCDRGPLGCEVMQHGKDYFTDKAPFTTREQLETARRVVEETGKKYMVYYSERLHVECAVAAGNLIEQGEIGRVIQVIGLGPHRLGSGRPDWFYNKEQYGGILIDIGSHQLEQFLHYTGATDGTVLSSSVGNYDNPDHPELEDFGQITVVGDNGATGYHRVDWFTPDGLNTWGDGRTIIMGTDGFIELRKYCNLGVPEAGGNHIFMANQEGTQHLDVTGKVGFPFFGQLILDSLNRTENAMTQTHAFKAAELCVDAQEKAVQLACDGGRPQTV